MEKETPKEFFQWLVIGFGAIAMWLISGCKGKLADREDPEHDFVNGTVGVVLLRFFIAISIMLLKRIGDQLGSS